MKRFLGTLAAMLLMSISAFAQNSTPLKGDVNEDGVVDVADIVAVIDIIKNGSQTSYKYLLVNEIPSTAPSANAWSTSTKTNTLGNLTGWDSWKDHKPQYIIFPTQSGKTTVTDYFQLYEPNSGQYFDTMFAEYDSGVSGIFVARYKGIAALDDANSSSIITFK